MKKTAFFLVSVLLFSTHGFTQNKKLQEKKEKKLNTDSVICTTNTKICNCTKESCDTLFFSEFGKLKKLPPSLFAPCFKVPVVIDFPMKQLQEIKKFFIVKYEQTLDNLLDTSLLYDDYYKKLWGNDMYNAYIQELRVNKIYIEAIKITKDKCEMPANLQEPQNSYLPSIASLRSDIFNSNMFYQTRPDSSIQFINGKYITKICMHDQGDSIKIVFQNPLKKFLFNELVRTYSQSNLDTLKRYHIKNYQDNLNRYTDTVTKLIKRLREEEIECESPVYVKITADIKTVLSQISNDPYLKTLKENQWFKMWLWYTTGPVQLNPFEFTTTDKFINSSKPFDKSKAEKYDAVMAKAYDSLLKCCKIDLKLAEEVIRAGGTGKQKFSNTQKNMSDKEENDEALTKFLQTKKVVNIYQYPNYSAFQVGKRNQFYGIHQYNFQNDFKTPKSKLPDQYCEPGNIIVAVHNVTPGKEVVLTDEKETKLDDRSPMQKDFEGAINDIADLFSKIQPVTAAWGAISSQLNYNTKISPSRKNIPTPVRSEPADYANNLSANKPLITSSSLFNGNDDTPPTIMSTIESYNRNNQYIKFEKPSTKDTANMFALIQKNAGSFLIGNMEKSFLLSVKNIGQYSEALKQEFITKNKNTFSNYIFLNNAEYTSSVTQIFNRFSGFISQKNKEINSYVASLKKKCEGEITQQLKLLFEDSTSLKIYSEIYDGVLPPSMNLVEEATDEISAYRTVLLEPEVVETPVTKTYSIATYSSDKPSSKTIVATGSYKVGKLYRFKAIAGIAYTAGAINNKTVTSNNNTISITNDQDRFRMMVGFKYYPCGLCQLSDKFVLRQRLSILLAVGIPKPLENVYFGAGVDVIPGVTISMGAHIFADKKYLIVNNQITQRNIKIGAAVPYFSVGIDPAAFVKLIGLFGKN